jgi:hypothetical protein
MKKTFLGGGKILLRMLSKVYEGALKFCPNLFTRPFIGKLFRSTF